jgi:hypothetical protein
MHTNIFFWMRLANFFYWVANHFWKIFKTQMDTSLKKSSTKTRVVMWIIFDSGRNVYVIKEPS